MPTKWRQKIRKLRPGQELTLTNSGTIRDTVKGIDLVSSEFSGSDKARELAQKETLKALFNTVLSHIRYKPDAANRQTIRSLERSLRDGVGNCVDYTTAISTVLKAKGVPHVYRLAGYSGNGFDHIYPVVQGVPMDLVTKLYGYEKPYRIKKDIMPKVSILNGNDPVEAIDRIAQQAYALAPAKKGAADEIYTAFGGFVRQMVRLARDLKYTPEQAQQIVTKIADSCQAIDKDNRFAFGSYYPLGIKGAHRKKCNAYVNRKTDDIYEQANDPFTVNTGNSQPGTGVSAPIPGIGGAWYGPSIGQTAPASNSAPIPGIGGAWYDPSIGQTDPASNSTNLASAWPLLAIAAGTLLLAKK